ncbi:MAG: DUF899 family protein [Thermoleophilaceae bacterium]|jgi:predicted dithiol-disulfide oxidoreductase (DUF899 family)
MNLPMVRVDEDYVFEGPRGEARPVDMFEGRPQSEPYLWWSWHDSYEEATR